MQSAELGVDACMNVAEPAPLIVQWHNLRLVVLGRGMVMLEDQAEERSPHWK